MTAPSDDGARAMNERVLGSGMSLPGYAAVLLASIVLFVIYDGPLWARHTHGMRFVVSYGAVIPMAAAVLVATRAFTWARLGTAVGTMWAIKLLVTAPMYYALAPGGALEDIEALPAVTTTATAGASPASSPSGAASGYRAADGSFAHGTLRIISDRGAIVTLQTPPPGRALADGMARAVSMTPGTMALVSTEDDVSFANTSERMHTARIPGVLNAPVPPSGKTSAQRLAAGLHRVSCAMHGDEDAALLVVDHPYAGRVDDKGSLAFTEVPATTVTVIALAFDGDVVRREKTVAVAADAITEVELLLGDNKEAKP